MVLTETQRLELLRAELPIIASKIAGTVDTLWKVRASSLTIWTAVLGAALGSFNSSHQPVLPLLVLGCLLPILFLNIDARNHRWYLRLREREAAISHFLNDSSMDLSEFPLFDLSGQYTFKRLPKADWEFSTIHSLVHMIPLTFYGGQFGFSLVACTIYFESPWRWMFMPMGLFLSAALLFWAYRKRKKLRADR